MLWEVAEAEEAERRAEEERKRWEEKERQRVEEEERWRAEEKWRAEEEVEEERKQVEAEQEEAQQLRDNLGSFKKGLRAMSAEEMAEIMAKLAEWAWKVRLGEGLSEQGPCWHCWSRKMVCIWK